MTWSMPDEPGPEITAVRDRWDVLWHRSGDQWWSTAEGLSTLRRWADLLARGPLTDASDEDKD